MYREHVAQMRSVEVARVGLVLIFCSPFQLGSCLMIEELNFFEDTLQFILKARLKKVDWFGDLLVKFSTRPHTLIFLPETLVIAVCFFRF